MQNAAMNRLSRLLAEPAGRDPHEDEGFAEGFFSLFLLLLIILCSVWSTQANSWISDLSILSLNTFIALPVYTWMAKQHLISRRLLLIATIVLSCIVSLGETILLLDNGSVVRFGLSAQQWWIVTMSGGHSLDDSLMLPLFIFGCLWLVFFSVFLLYRWHRPWLAIFLNLAVLLLNLNFLNVVYIFLLVIFLLASLLLIVRFYLFESLQRWDRLNLRYDEQTGSNIMKTGWLVAVVLLVVALVLPGNYLNPLLYDLWSFPGSPLVMGASSSGSASSGDSNGTALPNRGTFKDSWTLGGNPDLTNDVVLRVSYSNGAQPQYLALVSYDTYNDGWSIEHTEDNQQFTMKANQSLDPEAIVTQNVQQHIQVVSSLQEQRPYLSGASQVLSLSLPATVIEGTGGNVAWLGNNVSMNAGLQYTVTSAISSADVSLLRSIPMPDQAQRQDTIYRGIQEDRPVDYFSPALVLYFTQMASDLKSDGRIQALAEKIVADAHAQTMYDKAVALETYLRSHYSYSTDINPPRGKDPVLWFLFDNPQKDGYCNYFSTAFTLLARSLDIPTREVVGYTSGTREQNEYVIRGTDAHSWPQVYFAGYGWINFEPSASFSPFIRPVSQNSSSSSDTNSTGKLPVTGSQHNSSASSISDSGNGTGSLVESLVRAGSALGLFLLAMCMLLGFLSLAFLLWWRKLFRDYSLISQLYGRVCLLAGWGGLDYRGSQTPYEYLRCISNEALRSADEVAALTHLGDMYVQERWSTPDGSMVTAGEQEKSARLADEWHMLRVRLLVYVVHHPDFLRRAVRAAFHKGKLLIRRLRPDEV